MGTMPRSMRIPDDLWARAGEKAELDGTTVTERVIAFLEAYVRRPEPGRQTRVLPPAQRISRRKPRAEAER